MLYLDFSKAFDKVDLLHKLRAVGSTFILEHVGEIMVDIY